MPENGKPQSGIRRAWNFEKQMYVHAGKKVVSREHIVAWLATLAATGAGIGFWWYEKGLSEAMTELKAAAVGLLAAGAVVAARFLWNLALAPSAIYEQERNKLKREIDNISAELEGLRVKAPKPIVQIVVRDRRQGARYFIEVRNDGEETTFHGEMAIEHPAALVGEYEVYWQNGKGPSTRLIYGARDSFEIGHDHAPAPGQTAMAFEYVKDGKRLNFNVLYNPATGDPLPHFDFQLRLRSSPQGGKWFKSYRYSPSGLTEIHNDT